jgi:multiple sugar transport system permease protein
MNPELLTRAPDGGLVNGPPTADGAGSRSSRAPRASTTRRSGRPALLVAPSLLLVGAIYFVPILIVVWVSLQRTDYFELDGFVGLENYEGLLRSSEFWTTMRHTIVYVFGTLAAVLVVGMAIALLLQWVGPLRGFFRTALLVPWTLSQATVAIAWVWLLTPSYGPVAYLLREVGIGSSLILGSPDLAMPLLIAVTAWWSVPYAVVLLDASIQGLPDELYQAAAIDGASRVRTFFAITIPLLRPTIASIATFLSMFYFAMVTLPLVLTGGGPLKSTETLALNLFTDSIISGQDVGAGAATSMLMFLVNCVFGITMLRYGRDRT